MSRRKNFPPSCIVNNVASTYNHLQRPAECLINRRLTVITYFSFSLLPRSRFPFVSWLKIRFSFTFHEENENIVEYRLSSNWLQQRSTDGALYW